jgi:exopolyphosphatase/pppGpp-phosphohydrolase
MAHNYKMTTEDFTGIYDMLKALDVDRRKKIKGLSPARADIMPAAMAIVKSFLGYMNIEILKARKNSVNGIFLAKAYQLVNPVCAYVKHLV